MQAKIPKVVNILHRQFEGELTSMKTVDDPEYFPPFSIFGFQDGPRSYQFAGGETSNNSFPDVPANVDITPSMHLRSQNLQEYLERQCRLEGGMSLSMKEDMTKNPQMLRLGPFNAAYNPVQMNNSNSTRRLLAIRITVELEDVHCQATSAKLHTGVVLVSGILKGQVTIYQSSSSGVADSGAHWTFISVEQKPLAVEGTWNPVSGELHMVGCSPTNFQPSSSTPDEDSTNKTSGSRCDWKFCMKSVLRDSVTMDSPEGAVLSSLHEDNHQHHNYFEPLRFTRLRGTAEGALVANYFAETIYVFDAYRYTRISRALALAKKNRLNAGKRGLEPRVATCVY